MVQKNSENKPNKPARFHWFVWWKVAPDELNKQILEYDTLRFYQSARGIALLMLLFSAGLSLFLGYLNSDILDGIADEILFLIVGLFIFLGFKWANMIGMILWTGEKAYQIYGNLSAGSNGGLTVSILIWWSAYMQIFYLSFLIEKRRKQSQPLLVAGEAASQIPTPPTI